MLGPVAVSKTRRKEEGIRWTTAMILIACCELPFNPVLILKIPRGLTRELLRRGQLFEKKSNGNAKQNPMDDDCVL